MYNRDNLQCMKWRDKRDLLMLTTVDSCAMKATGKTNRSTNEPIMKPSCVISYNKFMGGVDRSDQLGKYYSFARKVMKVWKKEFFFLLNSMVLQGYLIYLKKTTDRPKKSQYAFRLELVRELVSSSRCIDLLPQHSQSRSSVEQSSLLRLQARHFPTHIPSTHKEKQPTRRCIVCKEKGVRKESIYWCMECGVSLCVAPCFMLYHTKKHYAVQSDCSDSD